MLLSTLIHTYVHIFYKTTMYYNTTKMISHAVFFHTIRPYVIQIQAF